MMAPTLAICQKSVQQCCTDSYLQHNTSNAVCCHPQVSKLHCLSSTASIPGIFSPPAAAAAAAPYTVAGQPLEQHLRAAVKHKVRVACVSVSMFWF